MMRPSKNIPAQLPQAETLDLAALCASVKEGKVDLICVLGPTASGKTRYAVSLAKSVREAVGRPVEIISADSRQIFRGMDIGTGKDLSEYDDVPYHLIDILEPGERYSVYQYAEDFGKAMVSIRSRGAFPILCGGTGLYINAVTSGYDFKSKRPLSELRQRVGDGNVFFIGTLVDRDTRNARIDARLDARLEEGMVEEIRCLLDAGVPAATLIAYGLEYKFVTQYVLGEISRDEMRRDLAIAIHQFAKRQMTWFRGMERSGVTIHWVQV